jgi:hypothetical protein
MTTEIMTRKQAADQGLMKYFTGKPCPRGHLSIRNTLTAACCKCLKENNRNAKVRLNTIKALSLRTCEIKICDCDRALVNDFVKLINDSRLLPGKLKELEAIRNYVLAMKLARELGL